MAFQRLAGNMRKECVDDGNYNNTKGDSISARGDKNIFNFIQTEMELSLRGPYHETENVKIIRM